MSAVVYSDLLIAVAQPGYGHIAGEAPGIVTIDNVPGRAEVDLLRRVDHVWLRRQYSGGAGTYRFTAIPLDVEYDVIARDITGIWDDVIVGRVLPFKPLRITGDAPAFIEGAFYRYDYVIAGGEGPYSFTLSGALPAGLELVTTGSSVAIEGTVSVGAVAASWTIEAEDARGTIAVVEDSSAPSAGFRYFRLTIPVYRFAGTVGSSGDTRISEFQIFEDATKYPVSGHSASASTVYSTFNAINAFDGVTGDSSRWISQNVGGTHWLQLDLGAGVSIMPTMCRIAPDSLGGSSHHPVDFLIEGSNSGVFAGEQSLLYSATGLTSGWGNSTLREFIF